MGKSLLVVNLRGLVNVPTPVKQTLEQLHLTKRFRATIVEDNEVYRGMLRRAMNHVAWCQADPSLVAELLEKRGKTKGWKPLDKEALKRMGYRSYKSLGRALAEGKVTMKSLEELKPVFTLSPPRKGLKRSSRRKYSEGGILGENPELKGLVERML